MAEPARLGSGRSGKGEALSGVMQSRGWRLEEEGQAGPSPASVHSPLALSAPRPDGLPRSLVSETKQSCLAHGAALGTELCAGGSCHFSHSSWRGSSGAGGFSCQVAHCLDSTGSPAGTVGLPTQESQAEVQSTVVPSHLQHLPEEQM